MTRNPKKVSRKNKYKEEATMGFDQMKTHVESHSKVYNRKLFEDIKVSASAKELYVHNFKIKWTDVLSLQVCTTPADSMGNYDNGKSDMDPDQVEFDNDGRWYREDCSIELRCRDKKSSREEDAYVPDDAYDGPVRYFCVALQPQQDRSLRTTWQEQWRAFRRTLQEFHARQLRKRQKWAEQEREEEEDRRKEQSRLKNLRHPARGRTYGKVSRAQKFLDSNRQNVRDNQVMPSDDEEEEFVARQRMKTEAETMERLKEQEDINNFFEQNATKSEDIEEVDHENDPSHEHLDGEEEEEEWDDNPMDIPSSQEPQDDADPMDVDVLEDSSNEGETYVEEGNQNEKPTVSEKKTTFRSRRKKIKAKAVVDDEDDSDDDAVFGSAQTLTTPSTQIVVSPGTIAARKRNVLVDSDDEDVGDGEKGESGAGEEPASATTTKNSTNDAPKSDEDKNIPKITSFFSRGGVSKSSKGKSISTKSSKGITSFKSLKTTTENKPLTPKRKDPEQTSKSFKPLPSSQSDDDSETSPPRIATHSTKAASSFFQPRRPLKTTTPSLSTKKARNGEEETPTEPGSQFSSARKHAVDTGSDDEAMLGPFSANKRQSLEDEDPIEEYESSQSPSNSRPCARRGKQTYSKKRKPLAIEALDFADKFSPGKSYRVVGSGERHSAYSRKRPINLSPPPLSAKKLNFEAHVDSNQQLAPKWRGLRNDGNTCYMNSSLQALYSIAQFMTAISSSQQGHELVRSLVQLWEQLNDKSMPYAASARPVKAVIDNLTDKFEGFEQRDAHEFLGEVIDSIHEELVKDGNGEDDDVHIVEPTDEYFRLDVEVCLTCKSCGYHRKKQEMYRNLSLDIVRPPSGSGNPLKPSVESCLTSFFQPEDREIKCEKCQEGQVATQQMKILSKPKALLLHLKRFIVEERPSNDENQPNGGAMELIYRKNKVSLFLLHSCWILNLFPHFIRMPTSLICLSDCLGFGQEVVS
jgi:hypothetical protein